MISNSFWQTSFLYFNRPNLINRRYVGSKIEFAWITTQELSLSLISNHIISSKQQFVLFRKLFRKQSLKSLQNNSENVDDYDIIILFPHKNLFALITIDYNKTNETIQLLTNDSCLSYTIGLLDGTDSKLQVNYLFKHQTNYWLENICKPKLEQWIQGSQSTTFQGSITKISVESYCSNYNRMKAKYSLPLLDIWEKVEKTDPIKFIFEDIAIASYLVTLWDEERSKNPSIQKQTFADIGCGNGLLVYILANEGFEGYGIDIRRRNIWNHYGPNIKLIEKQLDPFSENLDLPKVDWLIGNHSDELTPWIIYIASNMSPQTRAFLLPCCCYDFDGNKFQRTTDQDKSQYQCYLNYLEKLSGEFGFNFFRDKLRIPSTKRICLVCYDRNDQTFIDFETKKAFVQKQIQSRAHLRLRQKEIVVQNCTKISQEFKNQIIKILTDQLIYFQPEGLTLGEGIRLLDLQLREQLKNQCGGLQTFIRNHRNIFTIQDCRIQFQTESQLRRKNQDRIRTKDCWFHFNHPNGCKLSDDDCSYKH
ncbi:tRNA methyltransferase 44 [Blomia tropicalis]|nr:tRNA methyltransferase 44 [Blomia tropicalis]